PWNFEIKIRHVEENCGRLRRERQSPPKAIFRLVDVIQLADRFAKLAPQLRGSRVVDHGALKEPGSSSPALRGSRKAFPVRRLSVIFERSGPLGDQPGARVDSESRACDANENSAEDPASRKHQWRGALIDTRSYCSCCRSLPVCICRCRSSRL